MGTNGLPHISQHHHSRHSPPPDQQGPEDLIPTAIVIKNIPFAVKKEQLQSIMTDMHLPLPYAFNYHFDQGVFRGLAFANFTTAEETTNVINIMNGMELSGRKLRVEYKKMLPVHERDRIERDKRERRGQLQEQHQPISNGQLHNQGSMNSLNSNIPATSPSPISQRTMNKLGTYSNSI
jgi:RNA recognition motif-containing protein